MHNTTRQAPTTSGILANVPPFIYAGRVNCVTGYGAAARHQLWVLRRKHGARFLVHDTGSAGDPDPGREAPLVQEARLNSPGVAGARGSLIHVGPNCVGPFRSLPRPQALVSVWETSRLPREWVPIVNSFDQAWCATQWQADVYAASGVDAGRIRHVPFALDPALYPADGPVLPEIQKLRAEGTYVLGTMCQWTERKAPRTLIGAFVAAFTRGEKVALVLKAYEGDDPATSVASRVEEIVRSYLPAGPLPPIRVISRRLSHNETLAFYRGLHCYVSAHRGEGFGLPVAEALLLGVPVIATDWSAPAEYAAGCYHPIPYTLCVPHSMGWQPFYSVDQRWAEPDQGALIDAMRLGFEGGLTVNRALVADRFSSLVRRAGEAARLALRDLAPP